MRTLDIIAGARPNFMKIAPIIAALEERARRGGRLTYRLVHTGQHYDKEMSGSFFEQLGIPEPHINLGVGSGTQAEMTAMIMLRYEAAIAVAKPDMCLVVGDVTSTLACALASAKAGIPVAHVEGGIRSGDWTMPEEINRIATDAVADLFFTTSKYANENLARDGVAPWKIVFVGNTMIDTLLTQMPRFRQPELWDRERLAEKGYLVLTLHRPSNVDDPGKLRSILDAIMAGSRDAKVIWPVHPRVGKSAGLADCASGRDGRLITCDPLGYLEFNYLVRQAKGVVTDSGGITEETTVMGVPCITMRNTTERPETVTMGTNELAGSDPAALKAHLDRLFSGQWKTGSIPPLWDGHAASRIVTALEAQPVWTAYA